MRAKKLLFGLLFLLGLGLFQSCGNSFHFGTNEEGKILYDITYLENDLENFSTRLLPKNMEFQFKNNLTLNSIEGMMGAFYVKNVSDLRQQINITLLKILNNEIFYMGEKKEMPCSIDPYEGMKLQFTEDTATIAGLFCKKVLATLKDGEQFEVYYTNDIDLKNPNLLTPYKDIDGVLVQFRMELSKIKMEMRAIEYHECQIPDETFIVPEGFKRASREQLEKAVNDILE